MITASVGVDSSLLLEPARELLFPLPARGRSRCCLTLSNLSLRNDVVFRVRTRKPDAFTVRPTHGLLAPGASAQVVLSATSKTCSRLGAMSPHDLAARQSAELFLVQSVEREEDMRLAQTLDPDSSASLRAFWHKVPREVITENKLVCRFTSTAPPLPPLVNSNWASCSSSGSGSSPVGSDGNRRRAVSSNSYGSSISSDEFQSMRSGSSSELYSTSGDVLVDLSRSRRMSMASDTSSSFQTTIEGPPPSEGRGSIGRMSSVSNAQASMRDTTLTSFSVHDSEVSNDTMLSMDSTDSTDTIGDNADDAAHTPGPLLYSVHPSDTLVFQVQPATRFWGHSSFYVVNASQRDCLAFKVRTSNQQGYVVKPSRGLVGATSAQKVEVSLCAPRPDRPFDVAQREAKDAFLIEVANISIPKYNDLAALDERTRARELSALWSVLPSTGRESTMLTVELAMEGGRSDSERRSSNSPVSDANAGRRSSTVSRRYESDEEQRRTVGSVIESMRKLSTVTAMEPPPERRSEEAKLVVTSPSYEVTSSRAPESEQASGDASRSDSRSDSDTDSDYDYGDGGGAASQVPRHSAVVVVSADRMDTVDFSNPEVSFFM